MGNKADQELNEHTDLYAMALQEQEDNAEWGEDFFSTPSVLTGRNPVGAHWEQDRQEIEDLPNLSFAQRNILAGNPTLHYIYRKIGEYPTTVGFNSNSKKQWQLALELLAAGTNIMNADVHVEAYYNRVTRRRTAPSTTEWRADPMPDMY